MEHTPDDRAGTDRYSESTEGYSPKAEDPPEAEDEWWRDAGFATREAYAAEIERQAKELGLEPVRWWLDDPEPEPPPVDPPPSAARKSARSCQINIKLTAEDRDGLARAAEMYGVAPSTFARMLVSRGVRLALESVPEPGDS